MIYQHDLFNHDPNEDSDSPFDGGDDVIPAMPSTLHHDTDTDTDHHSELDPDDTPPPLDPFFDDDKPPLDNHDPPGFDPDSDSDHDPFDFKSDWVDLVMKQYVGMMIPSLSHGRPPSNLTAMVLIPLAKDVVKHAQPFIPTARNTTRPTAASLAMADPKITEAQPWQ